MDRRAHYDNLISSGVPPREAIRQVQWMSAVEYEAFIRSLPSRTVSGVLWRYDMKKLFLISVIGYSAVALILNHYPAMAATTGAYSAPWLACMIIDVLFALFAAFKLIGPAFFTGEEGDEAAIRAEDVNVPDSWLYGLFAIDLLLNLGGHGYQAIMWVGLASAYAATWMLVEVVGLFLTVIFFKNAQRAAHRAAKIAHANGPQGPRRVA
jgi:hypothetical protein